MQTRTLDEARRDGDLGWFAPALERLESSRTDAASFIEPGRPVTIARAPGRLDVMGGIADYSGSLVLEMPLACATFAIAQPQTARRLDVLSFRGERAHEYAVELDDLLSPTPSAPAALAAWFAQRPADRWAAYVVGAVYRCLTLADIDRPPHGLRLLITSDVPEGKGVSSSAALEVAAMAATAAAYDLRMTGAEIATACQWAENHVAGAPCGIMDQMTSSLGRQDRLLRLLCQPASVEGHVTVPAGYRFYGIDSGIRHAVTGADYGTVRTAAFMGYRIIADLAGLPTSSAGTAVRVHDDRWGGYLANIPPAEFATRFAERLPMSVGGAEFLARYGGITDSVTRIDPIRRYPVRLATSHPVHEHSRVSRFAALLESGIDDDTTARDMGELMIQSHESYGACGLGSDGTDRLVALARELGADRGLFGAKVTGGGSGGTVAILGTDAARDVIHEVAAQYRRETGRETHVFDGSGPGAEQLGTLRIE